jgi:hypothetical protein
MKIRYVRTNLYVARLNFVAIMLKGVEGQQGTRKEQQEYPLFLTRIQQDQAAGMVHQHLDAGPEFKPGRRGIWLGRWTFMVPAGERINKLVRNAEKAKVPVMCVVGAKEAEGNTLAVRTYADGELGAVPLADVISRVQAASRDRSGVF